MARRLLTRDRGRLFMSRAQRNHYRSLEKAVISAHTDWVTNTITLDESDFCGDEIVDSSFVRLKEESWFIPYRDQIDIHLPRSRAAAYDEDIRHKVFRELVKVRRERVELAVRCVIMFLAGIAALAAALYVPFITNTFFFFEIVIITSWMFIWVTVETWVVDGRVLYNQRFTLLQLLAARLTLY